MSVPPAVDNGDSTHVLAPRGYLVVTAEVLDRDFASPNTIVSLLIHRLPQRR